MAGTLPLTDDTIPLPPAEEPAPVGIAAAITLTGRMLRRAASGSAGGASEPGGCPRPSAGPGCRCGPCPDGDGDEVADRLVAPGRRRW